MPDDVQSADGDIKKCKIKVLLLRRKTGLVTFSMCAPFHQYPNHLQNFFKMQIPGPHLRPLAP